VVIDYKGYKITACTAPTAGVVALAALKIFEGYNSAATLNLTAHYLNESMKFGYGERMNLGDPSFVANVTTYEANMLRDKTAEDADIQCLLL
jgi:gamma-glutamyltranspeptidase / glutathione hydrolase